MKALFVVILFLFACKKETPDPICKTCITTGTITLPNHTKVPYGKDITITMNGQHIPYNRGVVYCNDEWIDKQGTHEWIEINDNDTTWYYTNTVCK